MTYIYSSIFTPLYQILLISLLYFKLHLLACPVTYVANKGQVDMYKRNLQLRSRIPQLAGAEP